MIFKECNISYDVWLKLLNRYSKFYYTEMSDLAGSRHDD